MARIIYLFLVVCAALFINSCKKEALKVHPEMEGHWRTTAVGPDGVIVEIKDGGTSTYNNYGEPGDPSSSGTAKLKSNQLKIGKEVLIIEEFPHYNYEGDYGMLTNKGWLIKSITPRILGIEQQPGNVHLSLWFADPSDQGFTHGYFNDHLETLDLQYKLQSASAWITITNWTTGDINNLLPASIYECRMKAHYPWGDSEYSLVTTFTTN